MALKTGPAWITVEFERVGFHCWPGATGERAYLADRHRHRFIVSVSLTVEHDDREVEFHDLLDRAAGWWPGPELGRQSCEDIARRYIHRLAERYPGRRYSVTVSEDGEVSATVDAADTDD